MRILAVVPGDYRVEASSGSSRFGPKTVTVRAGETAEAVLGGRD